MVEEQVPAVLGRLDDPGVDVGADGQAVGTPDAGPPEHVDRLGHRLGVLLHVLSEGERGVGARLGDAEDPGVRMAVEDGDVLGQSHLARGLVQLGQLDVVGTPVGVVQFLARR